MKHGMTEVFHSVKIILLAISVPSMSVCWIEYGRVREASEQPNRTVGASGSI